MRWWNRSFSLTSVIIARWKLKISKSVVANWLQSTFAFIELMKFTVFRRIWKPDNFLTLYNFQCDYWLEFYYRGEILHRIPAWIHWFLGHEWNESIMYWIARKTNISAYRRSLKDIFLDLVEVMRLERFDKLSFVPVQMYTAIHIIFHHFLNSSNIYNEHSLNKNTSLLTHP